jgi:hypothetical protein
MEADGPFPGAEDFAVSSGTDMSVEADVPSMAVDVASGEADAASVAVDAPSVEGDTASVEADMAAVVADIPSAEAEAEAVMVAGAGRFRSKPKLSRPTALAVGRCAER